MNVREIIKTYLVEHGYDGLYAEECGCALDDLIPCGDYAGDCQPGYKVRCDCEEHNGWHVGPERDSDLWVKLRCPRCGETSWEKRPGNGVYCDFCEFSEMRPISEQLYTGTVPAECNKCGKQCRLTPGVIRICECGGIIQRIW